MNSNVLRSLPQTKQVKGEYATIARLDGKATWQFLTMPNEISWDRGANYSAVATPKFPSNQYTRTDPWTLSISNLPLSTYWEEKSLTDYVAQLSALQIPDREKLSPPVLLWKWGQRLLSPCVMTRFSRTEDAWNGDGELLSCKISFSLLQVSDKILIS